MNDPYAQLKARWDRFPTCDRSRIESDILTFLSTQGIQVRQDDGLLERLTVAKPNSGENAFVIVLRYIKRNGRQTEDHFSFKEGLGRPSIITKGTLERRRPEYGGGS